MSFFTKAVVGALKAFPTRERRDSGRRDGPQALLRHRHRGRGRRRAGRAGRARRRPQELRRDRERDRRSGQGPRQQTRASAELQGGTFTITNGGVFGSLLSTPILNAPQVGILGMHTIQQRPVARNGEVVIRPMMYVALSYDHRIVDGSEAVQFLVRDQGTDRGPNVAAAGGLGGRLHAKPTRWEMRANEAVLQIVGAPLLLSPPSKMLRRIDVLVVHSKCPFDRILKTRTA